MFKSKIVQFIFQVIPFVIMIISVIVLLFSGESFSVESILLYTPDNYFLASAFLIFLYAIKSLSIFFPISALYVSVGIVFPIFPAILLNTVGTVICMAIGYCIGLFSISDYADKMIAKQPKLKQLVEKQRKNEWFISYFLRVCPISCDIVSVYFGSIRLPLDKYFLAGIVGCIPGIISATLLGVSINDPFSPLCIFAASMIIILTIVSYVLYRNVQKHKEKDSSVRDV